jgi:uncharacterized RDD family membrane protein YckC
MDPESPELNPYAPPEASLNESPRAPTEDAELAERSTRLGAVLIDGALVWVPLLFAGIAAAVVYNSSPESVTALGLLAIGGGLWWLGLSIFQWYRIATTGQSLGKKWTGIKIVKLDGSPVTFGSGVGMRSWLPGLISSIPYLGGLFALTDTLLIFRENRQCLHDEMAGTKVIVIRR